MIGPCSGAWGLDGACVFGVGACLTRRISGSRAARTSGRRRGRRCLREQFFEDYEMTTRKSFGRTITEPTSPMPARPATSSPPHGQSGCLQGLRRRTPRHLISASASARPRRRSTRARCYTGWLHQLSGLHQRHDHHDGDDHRAPRPQAPDPWHRGGAGRVVNQRQTVLVCDHLYLVERRSPAAAAEPRSGG